MASVIGSSVFEESDNKSIKSSFQQILTNFPKKITRRNLKELLWFLIEYGFVEQPYEEDGISALFAVIFNQNNTLLERLLACSCFQQMAPLPDLCETAAVGQLGTLMPFLPVALIQGSQDKGFKKLKDKLLSHIEGMSDQDVKHHKSILCFLSQCISSSPWNVSIDDTRRLSSALPACLKQQSRPASPPRSASRFRKSDNAPTVYEIDGTPSSEIFTALSYVENHSVEQELNVYCFSILRTLLVAMQPPAQSSNSDLCPESSLQISDELSNTIRCYCLRIIEQAERKPQIPMDSEIQKACLVEAVNLLSLLCYANPNYVPTLLPSVRVLYERNVMKKLSLHDIAVLTATANFLVRHGGVIMHKMADICPFLLKDVVALCYQDNWASYEIITFVRENLNILCYQTSSLEKYFPSLFKILAWNPVCFESDFQTILPACMSAQTSVEVFHALLDLPCLTASLLIRKQMDTPSSEGVWAEPSVVQHVNQPTYQGMFSFILRPVSGMGDTANRIQAYHEVIKPLAKHPLVVACAEAVISLLKSFFQVFTLFADMRLTSLLLPAILERVLVIYEVPGYAQKVNNVLAEALLDLLKDHPGVCIYLLEDFMSFIGKEKNLTVASQFYINLVWAVGEYTNVNFSEVCTPEVITSYYEGLECVVYELLPSCFEKQMFRFLCVAVTTLAKLSASCQDLLQRALLCLGKVGKQAVANTEAETPRSILIERVRQLMALLQSPNLASQLLNPPKEILSGRWHRDITAESFLMKTVTTLVKSDVQQ